MAKSPQRLKVDAFKEEAPDRERFSSIEGLVSTDSEQFSNLNDADRLYEGGLLLNFKKEYTQAIDYLDKAYRIFSKRKQFLGAIRCLVELAWLRYNHSDEADGVTKANRLFADAQLMIDTHINEPGINETRARLLHYRGLVKYRQEKFGEGVKLFHDARTFCRPDGLESAKILDSLGIHYERTGDFHRAVACLERSLAIKHTLDIPWEEAVTAQILGRLYLIKENYPLALRYLEQSLDFSERLEDVRRMASIRNELIKLWIHEGDLTRAAAMIEAAEAENREKGLSVALGMTLFYKCYLAFLNRDLAYCGEHLHREVVPLFKRNNFSKGLGKALRLQAGVESLSGENPKAIETMGSALALFKETGLIDEQAKTHYEMGKIFAAMNDRKLALASLLEALKVAELNGLRFLTSYIEDEIYRIDEAKWQEIVDKRSRHERLFEKEHTLLDALSALSEKSGGENGHGLGDQAKSLISLLRVGQAMSGERDLDRLLYLIKDETERALDADRCTVFLYDREKNELWSKVASGLDRTEEIRFPAHLGLAGYVCKTGEVLNIKNAYDDPRFNKEVDKKTGYKTENLLCMPMRNRRMEIIGVFQVLNKRDTHFEKADEDLLMAIAASACIAIENAVLDTDRKVAFESFIKTLSSTIDARDPITAGHSERVAEYAILLGDEMQMVDDEIEALKYASLLHDIGKIGIREDILVKDGRLTQKEYRHIQKHAYYTYEILKNIYFEKHLRSVPEIAASHHEKMDGSGYFRGLKEKDIPISGRILALSDVFDAITSRRHYRNRMPFDKVLGILRRDAGSHFDPDCVQAFFNLNLFKLGQVLLMESRIEVPSDLFGSLSRDLDRDICVREYESLLLKEKMSKAEADIHRVFSSLYHRGQLSDLD